jgi:hypothetical protein
MVDGYVRRTFGIVDEADEPLERVVAAGHDSAEILLERRTHVKRLRPPGAGCETLQRTIRVLG